MLEFNGFKYTAQCNFMPVDRVDLGIARRFRGTFFLLPAMLSPHSKFRVFFHRLRGVKIEARVEIGYLVMIDNLYPHMVTIKEGATISYGSTIVAHDESRRYARGDTEVIGPVEIGKRAFLGAKTMVLPGVRIGERSIIGAASLINKDVDPDSVVVGIPFSYIERNRKG